MAKIHPVFNLSAKDALSAFDKGAQAAKGSEPNYAQGKKVEVKGRNDHGYEVEFTLYVAFLSPREVAWRMGYDFGQRPRGDKELAVNRMLRLTVGERQEAAFHVEVDEGSAQDVTFSFALWREDEESVSPSRKPDLRVTNDPTGDLAHQTLTFPLYKEGEPFFTDEMSKGTVSINIMDGGGAYEFELR